MANKLQQIKDLSFETSKEITSTPEKWLEFLDTASNNYKYSFQDQVLIYAQRPYATACADINTWNTRLHRWIQKGAKGIALITNDGTSNSLRHVFDISDTYDKFGRNVFIWKNNHKLDNEIIEAIAENKYISGADLSEKLSKSPATIQRHLKLLSEKGLIRRIGSRKAGYWEIIKK